MRGRAWATSHGRTILSTPTNQPRRNFTQGAQSVSQSALAVPTVYMYLHPAPLRVSRHLAASRRTSVCRLLKELADVRENRLSTAEYDDTTWAARTWSWLVGGPAQHRATPLRAVRVYTRCTIVCVRVPYQVQVRVMYRYTAAKLQRTSRAPSTEGCGSVKRDRPCPCCWHSRPLPPWDFMCRLL